MNIDELIIEYKKLNDQLANSNLYQEKIFRSMMQEKGNKAINKIKILDYINIVIVIGCLLFFTFSLLQFQRKDFIIFASGGFLISLYLLYLGFRSMKATKQLSFSSNSIEENLLASKNLKYELDLQKVSWLIVMIPFMWCLITCGWMARGADYINLLSYFWMYNLPYLIFLITAFIISFASTPWYFRVTVYKWLKDLNQTLKELQE